MGRVAVVMICRDDARGVERALLSVKPYVDELVVVDLGSVDDTPERARRCGARVETAVWGADRAALRNHALQRTDAEWAVVLEAGEWLDGGGAGLEELRGLAPDRVGLVDVVPGAASRGLAPVSMAPRILPRGVRFAGGHREHVVIDGLDVWRTGVVIASDDADAARWRHDRSSGEMLLLQALSVQPDDPHLLAQLGDILRSQGRLAEACEVLAAALEVTDAGEATRHALVVDTLDTLRQAGRFAEAIALMDAEMPHWTGSPDFSFAIGDLFFEIMLAQPEQAPQLAPLAETSWLRCLEIGDRPDLPGTLTGRGSFLAAQNLATLRLVLGDEAGAQEWWTRADRLRLDESLGRSARLPG
ncbi:hypothetical protein [Agilicoccus flavus]|uniref:hypothetical protein n=1 Tax=Agilicoccus flavus TaxID=2775968 RepID=UPI001CF6F317|nr:hypothetical protein [Agilicoccus flavus]